MGARLLVPALLALAAGPVSAASAPEPALLEGNRLFRRGELQAAVDVYLRGTGAQVEATGVSPAAEPVDPILAYNLGTALHRLGRLPEAVLWYRRAQAGAPHDPWIRSNLQRARHEMGAPRPPAPGPVVALASRPWMLQTAGALAAWIALGAALGPGGARRGRWVAGLLLGAALALWSAGPALRLLGPRPAVLLEACGELPAGTEVWVRTGGPEAFRVLGEDTPCAPEGVGLVPRLVS